jgi:hypothetical protein
MINQNGFFFTLRQYDGVIFSSRQVSSLSEFSGLADAEIRGSVILHELAHAFGALPSDGDDSEQSKRNSQAVKFFCFSNFAKSFRPGPVNNSPGDIGGDIMTRPIPGELYLSIYSSGPTDLDWLWWYYGWDTTVTVIGESEE